VSIGLAPIEVSRPRPERDEASLFAVCNAIQIPNKPAITVIVQRYGLGLYPV
jgi:hypothetical protein